MKKASKEVRELRQIMIDAGENPDLPKVDLTERNKQFFIKWKMGVKFTDIAKEFQCSTTTVSKVCHRIEFILENERSDYNKYADLNKF